MNETQARISQAQKAVRTAEMMLWEAQRQRCSSAIGWRDELERRRKALADLYEELK